MAKLNVGQLVYTVEVDSTRGVRALQTFESRAASSSRAVVSHFDRFDKTAIKAQKSLIGLASAADLLGGSVGRFVFGGIRAVDLITSLGASASRTSEQVKGVSKELNALRQVERSISGEIVARANEPVARVRRGAGGRFESIPGSAAAAAARTAPIISTADMQALAVGPTIERSAVAAQRASSAMTALGKAASGAGAALAYLGAGLKAIFLTPVGLAILAVAAAFAIYEKASRAAAEADERRKKAIEAATEASRRQIDALKKSQEIIASASASGADPSAEGFNTRLARARLGGGKIDILAAEGAISQFELTRRIDKERSNIETIREQLFSKGFQNIAEVRSIAGLSDADIENSPDLTDRDRAKWRERRNLARQGLAASDRSYSAIDELTRQRELAGQLTRKNVLESIATDIREAGKQFKENIMKAAEESSRAEQRAFEKRIATGKFTDEDVIKLANERGNAEQAQSALREKVRELLGLGKFGKNSDAVLRAFGFEEFREEAEQPTPTPRFTSRGLIGSSVGGFTRADVIGSGQTPEDEQVQLLKDVRSILTKIERKPVFGGLIP